jgi:hypothetical protein
LRLTAFKVPQAGLEPARSNEHRILSPACLPIPPPGLRYFVQFFKLSEKRDSNPRPRPWQGRALPAELFSHCGCKYKKTTLVKTKFLKVFYPIFLTYNGINMLIDSESCLFNIFLCTIMSTKPFSNKNSDVWNPSGRSRPMVSLMTRGPANPIKA